MNTTYRIHIGGNIDKHKPFWDLKTSRSARSVRAILPSVVALASIVVIGACSSSRDSLSASAGVGEHTAADYASVAPGFSASFVLRDSAGLAIGSELYAAGSAVSAYGRSGVSWTRTHIDSATQTVTNGVIFWDYNSVYHKSDDMLVAERLVSGPFIVGSTWGRLMDSVSVVNPGDGSGNTGNDGNTDGGGSTGTTPGPNLSSFAIAGSNQFYIAAFDTTVTSGDKVFSHCLEVVNTGQNQSVNRYWYCPGEGLVRYSQNCPFGVYTGTVNAERN